ncbi:MAG TPA: diaminopropionate ammonia-lyase [Azospirillaceae bacterium]|nr:diaminopropionate ammonia-lyase [Azospirillaceae bacterium]
MAVWPRPSGLFINPRASAGLAYGAARRSIVSRTGFAAARDEIATWPEYAPAPLLDRPDLASEAEIGRLWIKDESGRFGLGSFKALGGAYAVFRLLKREVEAKVPGVVVDAGDLAAGRWLGVTQGVTVTCATDGNHGRSVAWGAGTFGCNAVIHIHAGVSAGRQRALENLDAHVIRIDGTYDEAVREAAINARLNGWHIVSDTTWPGYMDIPRDVMQGYTVMVEEVLEQLPADERPTHVFVQAGVGALPAAVAGHLWETLGPERPRFVVVEPDKADCHYRSAVAGCLTPAEGKLDTVMAGLACGEVSPLAWAILEEGGDAFLTLPDEAAVAAMRRMAAGNPPRMVGEAGVAGLAGLMSAASDAQARAALGLGPESRVLVFATEGATDPELWRTLIG